MTHPVSPLSHTSSHSLRALAGKYRTLASLRRDKLHGHPAPPREVFRALSHSFPGSLRELDILTLDEIDARAEALERSADGTHSPQPWMLWLDDYHRWMRVALDTKLRLRGARAPDDDAVLTIANALTPRAGVPVSAAFVRAVAQPPCGRINNVVLEHVCALHNCAREHVVRTLFPKHSLRPSHPEQQHPEP